MLVAGRSRVGDWLSSWQVTPVTGAFPFRHNRAHANTAQSNPAQLKPGQLNPGQLIPGQLIPGQLIPGKSNVVLRPAKERGSNPRMGLQGNAPNPAGTAAQSLAKCIAGWQATSDMTREEWRHGCEVQNKGASGQNVFAVCVADWDAATHMSRLEWRNACLRSVKEDPTAFH